MNSKDRSKLIGVAANIEAVFQIGKEGISDNLIKIISDYLFAHEIIKLTVLKNTDDDKITISEALAKAAKAEVVKVIGSKIILYKKSDKKDIKHVLI